MTFSHQAAEMAGCEQTGFARGFCDGGSSATYPPSPAHPSCCPPSSWPPTSTPAPCAMASWGCTPSPQEGPCCLYWWCSHPQAPVPALLENRFPARQRGAKWQAMLRSYAPFSSKKLMVLSTGSDEEKVLVPAPQHRSYRRTRRAAFTSNTSALKQCGWKRH